MAFSIGDKVHHSAFDDGYIAYVRKKSIDSGGKYLIETIDGNGWSNEGDNRLDGYESIASDKYRNVEEDELTLIEAKVMGKFKVGDIVRSNGKYDYGVTTTEVRCEVISKEDDDNEIEVKVLDGFDKGNNHFVNSKNFDLEKSNKSNKTNKPKKKGIKIMSIIKNAMKSKENKAIEYFELGNNTNDLNSSGRQEFQDYIYETGDVTKKGFLEKIVAQYEKEIKK